MRPGRKELPFSSQETSQKKAEGLILSQTIPRNHTRNPKHFLSLYLSFGTYISDESVFAFILG